jgi:hypothetical protein
MLKSISSGLDASFVLGIHWAHLKNFVWGDDFVFTYGPLSYLFHRINIDSDLWLQTITYKIISTLLFYTVLALFVLKTSNPIRNSIVLGLISLFLTRVTFVYFPLMGLLLGFYLYLQYAKNKLFLIPLIFGCSFLAFQKFDGVLISLSFIGISSLYFIYKKRYWDLSLSAFLYPIFTILIWITLTGSMDSLLTYFSQSFEIASEYSEGNSTILPTSILVLFSIPVFVLFGWWFFEYWNKDRQNIKFLLLSAFSLFAFYKLGFVREGHMHIFFILSAFILFTVFTLTKTKNIQPILRYSTIILVGLLFSLFFFALDVNKSPRLTFNDDLETWFNGTMQHFDPIFYKSGILTLNSIFPYFDETKAEVLRNDEKNSVKKEYPKLSPDHLKILENKTVNPYPWDISMLYIYDLEWAPNPLMQSQISFSPELDHLDSEYYASENSPEYIIMNFKTRDKQFFSFTEPASLRTIVCNYNLIEKLPKKFHILEKSSFNKCLEKIPLFDQESTFNEEIKIPESGGGLVFANIFLERNLLGEFAKFFYKTPQVYVEFDKDPKKYRFAYPNGINGVLLSNTKNFHNLPPIQIKDIKSMKFSTLDEKFFKNQIKIEFYKINLKTP